MKVNTFGFYPIAGTEHVEFFDNSRSPSFIDFMTQVREKNSDFSIIILILDNFRTHRSKAVIEEAKKIGIELIYVPLYSPDLNPIEYI